MKFTKKGTAILLLVLLTVFGFAALYEDIGLAEFVFAGLAITAAYLVVRLTGRNNSLSDVSFADVESETAEAPGSRLEDLLADLEDFEERNFGRYGIHISRKNSKIDVYPIPDLEGETWMLYSIITADRDTGQDIHIIVEANTGTIVKHGQVDFKSQYRWPFDHCHAVEALEKASMRRQSNSIRQTLQAMNQGQLEGSYNDIVMDKDIRDSDAVINVSDGGR